MPVSDRLRHTGKRWLHLTHRWVGIVSCLFFAMWFASGLVMIYVPFPELTLGERLARLDPIDWPRVVAGPQQALAAAGQQRFPDTLVLEAIGEEPVWRITTTDGGDQAVSAASGRLLRAVEPAQATAIAARFGGSPVRRIGIVARDQWTVASGFDRHRPLYRADLADAAHTSIYLAAATGAAVLDTTRRERGWNWVGAVPHWLYPTLLRKDQPLWRQVVLWTAGAGIVGAVTGMWIGILRIRLRRRYKGGRTTPYRGWQWVHHLTGLAGGALLTTWIVSGWLSVDPGRWFASPGLPAQVPAAYADPGVLPQFDPAAIARLPEAAESRRMRILWVHGQALLVFENSAGTATVREAGSLARHTPDLAALARSAWRAHGGAEAPRAAMLHAPDAYWYKARGTVELPVLRLAFDDPHGTWLYLSAATGEIVGESDSRRRTYRWLYDGLHRWDFRPLTSQPWLWYGWMWLWSVAGIVISVSGVVIGYRRLAAQRKHRPRGTSAASVENP